MNMHIEKQFPSQENGLDRISNISIRIVLQLQIIHALY